MKKRVLVVDDEAPMRECLKKVLERANYEVLLAADGQEAIERFASSPIDLSILDIDLPIRSGWDVFERLTSRNPCLPVIILTGLHNRYGTAAAAGVGALLEKPFEAGALLRTMTELLAESNEDRLLRVCGYRSATRHLPAGRRPDDPFRGRLRPGTVTEPPRFPEGHPHWGIHD